MFWKIYLWTAIVLSAVGLGVEFSQPEQVTWLAWSSSLIFTPVMLLALWCVAYKRAPLPVEAWKVLLCAAIFWDTVSVGAAISGLQSQLGDLPQPVGIITTGVASLVAFGGLAVIMVPPLVALYRLGYRARAVAAVEDKSIYLGNRVA